MICTRTASPRQADLVNAQTERVKWEMVSGWAENAEYALKHPELLVTGPYHLAKFVYNGIVNPDETSAAFVQGINSVIGSLVQNPGRSMGAFFGSIMGSAPYGFGVGAITEYVGGWLDTALSSMKREFTHWSQWARPADNAWQDYLRDLNNAYRATGKTPIVSSAEPMHGGQRIWGGFDPATERITLYKGWDMSTAFEELLHWEDLPRLKNYFVNRTPGWNQARWDAAIAARTGADWNNIYAVAEQRVRARMIANGFTPKP